MKRLKIVFGAAALLLAGIGAFATNAKGTLNNYYYLTGDTGNPCTIVGVDFQCFLDSNIPCKGVAGDSSGKQLFLTDDCDQPLEKVI